MSGLVADYDRGRSGMTWRGMTRVRGQWRQFCRCGAPLFFGGVLCPPCKARVDEFWRELEAELIAQGRAL